MGGFLKTRESKLHLKHLWDTCQKCWLRINTVEDPNWIEKNRKAQLIIQNKPEQKIKNAEAVSKSWTKERRKKASDTLKEKWKDPKYAKKILKGLSWTQKNDDHFREIMLKSAGVGGYKGVYEGLEYDSCLELSYILWCKEKNIPIKRYDLDPIDYKDENGKSRKYFPDFVIYKDVIIEIKGKGLYYKKNFIRNQYKISAAKKLNKKYEVILEGDESVKKFYRLARRIHNENQRKKDSKL